MALLDKLRTARRVSMQDSVQRSAGVKAPSNKPKVVVKNSSLALVKMKGVAKLDGDVIDGEWEEDESHKVVLDPQGGQLSQAPPSVMEIIERVQDLKTHWANYFRPSMIFGCTRANYFYYMHAPTQPKRLDNRMMRILDNGTAVHKVIQEYLADHPDVWFVPEARVLVDVNGALIRGSCDGILIRRADMYRWGVEIKTINTDAFVKLKKPDKKHVGQATIYAKLNGVEWITILYWDKNTQHMKEYPVHVSQGHWVDVKARIVHLKTFVDKRMIPKFSSKECSPDFCEFVDHCRAKGAPV